MHWRSALVAAISIFLLASSSLSASERIRPDAAALAAEIDRLVGEKLKDADVTAAPRSNDWAFFRRLNLAIAGRVPVASEARAFLADKSPDKRARAIEKLLASAAYANHMTVSWTGWLLPEAATDPNVANTVPGFEAWLRSRIRDDVSFDRIATELLTYPLNGRASANQAVDEYEMDAGNGPLAFYTAKDGKPENLAAATARVFLGVHLECAQCHDHPMAKWKRDQFWGLAAFFGGIERSNGALRETLGKRELLIPNSTRAVPATLLDDREPEWQYKKSLRATLATWAFAAENPFFARAMVNRLWWLVFGVGIVDPVDDFHDQNPPSHPDLLNTLARAFVESGFDTKFIVRAICLSETFGRSSAPPSAARQSLRLYAHFPMQGLSPEQLYDSLTVVLGDRGDDGSPRLGPGRQQFLEAFALSGQRTENPTTILQALTLMNGGQVGAATNMQSGRLLRGLVKLPGLTPEERIEALYFTVLSRPPRPTELERSLTYVKENKDGPDKAYADVLWALLNGIEFRTNH
jgi:hypothetical protein